MLIQSCEKCWFFCQFDILLHNSYCESRSKNWIYSVSMVEIFQDQNRWNKFHPVACNQHWLMDSWPVITDFLEVLLRSHTTSSAWLFEATELFPCLSEGNFSGVPLSLFRDRKYLLHYKEQNKWRKSTLKSQFFFFEVHIVSLKLTRNNLIFYVFVK